MFIQDDWRSDGYRWVQIAARRLPTHNPVIKKCYFHAGQKNKKKSKDFEKQAFVSLVDPSKVVVQYLGDENVAEEFPHGNSKKNTKPFFRTRPSLLNKLISEAATNAETAQIFKQYTTNNSTEHEDDDDDAYHSARTLQRTISLLYNDKIDSSSSSSLGLDGKTESLLRLLLMEFISTILQGKTIFLIFLLHSSALPVTPTLPTGTTAAAAAKRDILLLLLRRRRFSERSS